MKNSHFSGHQILVISISISLTFGSFNQILADSLKSPDFRDTPIIDIGSHLELFVDHYLIGRFEGGAGLKLHQPKSQNVAIIHDAPWEGNTSGYHTIFRDGDIYRMYYRGSRGGSLEDSFICYAESTDGINFFKPELGIVEFDGSTANNIIIKSDSWDIDFTHVFVPFKDSNPNCPPEEQYKAIARKGQRGNALSAFVSEDGIHWTRVQDSLALGDGKFDSQNLAFWDNHHNQYRIYYRDWIGGWDGIRAIKTASSKDFFNWTGSYWLEYPGAPTEHLYTNQIMPYYRAPHIYVGFPTRFFDPRRGFPNRASITDGLFMSSRDGIIFNKWAEAFIRPGLNREKWGNRGNYVWWGLVETSSDLPGAPDDLSLYTIEGYYQGNSNSVRRYTIRIDGFVSVNAPFSGGEVITKPLLFSGDSLVINYSTSAGGSVRVELQEADGTPIQGYTLEDCPEIFGDEIEGTVKWEKGSSVAKLNDKPVRIRFVMKDADLFSFCFIK